MKKTFSIALIVLIAIHISASLLIWGVYPFIREQITEKYCEFYLVDRLCNGQCFIRKIIIKTEQQEQPTALHIKLNELSPVLPCEHTILAEVLALTAEQLPLNTTEGSPFAGFAQPVFHPPAA